MIYNLACDISSSLTNHTDSVFILSAAGFALGFVLALFKKLRAQKLGFALTIFSMLFLVPAIYDLFLKQLDQVKLLFVSIAVMAVMNIAVFTWLFRIKRSAKDRAAKILKDIMVIRPLSAALLSGTSKDTDLMKW